MDLSDIVRRGAEHTAFWEKIPSRSASYVRTAIAFANSQGGMLIFGASEGLEKITGFDPADTFSLADRIGRTISRCCAPLLFPETELCTVDPRCLIVVTVSPGRCRPYYLRSAGRDGGTFIRAGGVTCRASAGMIRELAFDDSRIPWDRQICAGYRVTGEAIGQLCAAMNDRRRRMRRPGQSPEDQIPVTEETLAQWNLIRKCGDICEAANAFVLMTSDFFPSSGVRCAVYRGCDRQEVGCSCAFSGPLYEQVEKTVSFILEHTRSGTDTGGAVPGRSRELPAEAVREMVVNAVCHRSYTLESRVQVDVFADRVEVTSPGGLPKGLTLEEALAGHSRLRNLGVTNVFLQIGLLDSWGTGLQRMQSLARDLGLRPPEFVAGADFFRVTFFRTRSGDGDSLKTGISEELRSKPAGISEELRNKPVRISEEFRNKPAGTSEELRNKPTGTSEELRRRSAESAEGAGYGTGDPWADEPEECLECPGDRVRNKAADPQAAGKDPDLLNKAPGGIGGSQILILQLLKDNPRMTAELVSRRLGLSRRGVEYSFQKLKKLGLIVRRGPTKNGCWQVTGR